MPGRTRPTIETLTETNSKTKAGALRYQAEAVDTAGTGCTLIEIYPE